MGISIYVYVYVYLYNIISLYFVFICIIYPVPISLVILKPGPFIVYLKYQATLINSILPSFNFQLLYQAIKSQYSIVSVYQNQLIVTRLPL